MSRNTVHVQAKDLTAGMVANSAHRWYTILTIEPAPRRPKAPKYQAPSAYLASVEDAKGDEHRLAFYPDHDGYEVDLASLTPPQVDTLLRDASREYTRAQQRVAWEYDTVHQNLGERQIRDGKRRVWPTSHEKAEQTLRAKVESGEFGMTWEATRVNQNLEKLDETRAARETIHTTMAALDAEYARRPWSRFFVVHNGHIHSSRSCTTCYPTTEYGWIPELSGLTEADAVASQGTILCSICFPSAPVEWTVGKQAPPGCDGTDKEPAGNRYRAGMTEYGNCSVCGASQVVKANGRVRKHKPAPDTESSASRQHHIDTGRYLRHGEARQA